MSAPVRIQRKRTKGWTMPENTVYVGRPSRWGNPFRPSNKGHATFWYVTGWGRRFGCERGEAEAHELAVALFRSVYEERERYPKKYGLPDPAELRGKNLACWCPLDQACHADVLLELANGGTT